MQQAPVNGLYPTIQGIQDVGRNSMASRQGTQQVHQAGPPHTQKQPLVSTALQTQVSQPVHQLPKVPAPPQATHQTAQKSRPPPPVNHDDIYGDEDYANEENRDSTHDKPDNDDDNDDNDNDSTQNENEGRHDDNGHGQPWNEWRRPPQGDDNGAGRCFDELVVLRLSISLWFLEIDEQSPDEDERQALAVIRQQSRIQSPQPAAIDVLVEHQRRNRVVCLPTEERLRAVAQQQLYGGNNLDVDGHSPEPNTPEDDSEDEDEESGSSGRARRHTKSDGSALPTTLRFYHDNWKVAIEEAKRRFRGYILLQNAFPTRDEHLHEAAHILTEVIEEMKNEEAIFDEGIVPAL